MQCVVALRRHLVVTSASHAGKSHLLREPPHGAVGDLDAFASQLLPDLQLAVATVEALVVDALNLNSQFLVTTLAGRGRSGLRVVVGGVRICRTLQIGSTPQRSRRESM